VTDDHRRLGRGVHGGDHRAQLVVEGRAARTVALARQGERERGTSLSGSPRTPTSLTLEQYRDDPLPYRGRRQ
jgi:hypothetical protein